MLWCLGLFLAAVAAVPDAERPVWNEYGLESVDADSGVTRYRFKDPTGAFAAFQWHAADPSFVHYENYLLKFDSDRPSKEMLEGATARLPKVVRTALPPLPQYMPENNKVPGSDRSLLGPASLAQFEPRINQILAAFDRGGEGQTAKYRIGGRELQLSLFSYPTPRMAGDRIREFEKMAGVVARRLGPLVAVVPDAPDRAAAERLLQQISYAPKLTWTEEAPSQDTPQDAARMILAISVLAAALIAASVVLGLFFGGAKTILRKFGIETASQEFTTLHLSDK